MFNGLKSYNVIIPRTPLFKKLMEEINGSSNLKRAKDYIKSITVIHQKYRETDKNGNLISNDFDVLVALTLYQISRGGHGKSLNNLEIRMIEELTINEPQTYGELATSLGVSYHTILNHAEQWCTKRLVKMVNVNVPIGHDATRSTSALELHDELKSNNILNHIEDILKGTFQYDILEVDSDILKFYKELIGHINNMRSKYGLDLLFHEKTTISKSDFDELFD